MSKGVYRALKAIDGGCRNKSENDILVEMIEKYIAQKGWNNIAINILQEICQTQYDLYRILASENAHSRFTRANRKRGDMTLVIYKF